jgi:ATP-dependent DNA ligase
MARQLGSRHEVGRSTTLLKIKSFRDAEARELRHRPGAGRHKGRLGALLVRDCRVAGSTSTRSLGSWVKIGLAVDLPLGTILVQALAT